MFEYTEAPNSREDSRNHLLAAPRSTGPGGHKGKTLDLGVLPNGEKVTINQSDICPICNYGVQQAECEDCAVALCPSCIVPIGEVPLCVSCFMNREG